MSLALLGLFGLLLLQLGAIGERPGRGLSRLTAVTLSGDRAPRQTTPHRQARSRPATQPHVQPVATPQPVPTRSPLVLIPFSHSEMAAADIGRMAPPAPAGGSDAGNSASAYGPGEGPGGARLYNAEWVREPSDAEMRGYMPAQGTAPGSWAVIACKTVEHFRVDNCQQLDESPPGSGLSRALRQAAWQFLVRPPRIDGKPVVGAWVRIRFDFGRAHAG
ncbi:MAG: hypothetical protein KGM17_03525 [Sphingomonadales bacterium]|nr:hypothetical protein [Sphingomonadales bacterium]